jgi:hypothetical protein
MFSNFGMLTQYKSGNPGPPDSEHRGFHLHLFRLLESLRWKSIGLVMPPF